MKSWEDYMKVVNYSTGSTQLFRHYFAKPLVFTEGVKDFANTMEANWLVDVVASYMPSVVKQFRKDNDGFYIVKLALKKTRKGTHSGDFKIIGGPGEDIIVAKQHITYVDLPLNDNGEDTIYKFYLQYAGNDKFGRMMFTLMLPSEY